MQTPGERPELHKVFTPECDGLLQGKRFRRSLGLRDWACAVKRVEKWETDSAKHAGTPEVTIDGAVTSYLGDCKARNLKSSTIGSYQKTLEHLRAFAATHSCREMDDLDLAFLTDFRASRSVAPSTSRKELETLRAFCAFAKKTQLDSRELRNGIGSAERGRAANTSVFPSRGQRHPGSVRCAH